MVLPNERKVKKSLMEIKELFCKHDYQICRRISIYQSLRGEQLYKVCQKCGKVKKYIYREYEGFGYK